MDRDERERIIGDIYEAAIVSERWVEVITTLSERFGFCGGAIVYSGGNWTITPSIEDIFGKFTAGGWLERNERLIRL